MIAAGTRNFLWIEADIEGYGGTYTTYHNNLFVMVKHTVIRNSTFKNAQTSSVVFKNSRKNLIYDTRIINSQTPATIGAGLQLLTTSDNNTIQRLFTSVYYENGIEINSSSYNRLNQITGFNNNLTIQLDGASGGFNTIVGILSASGFRGVFTASGTANSQNTFSHVSVVNSEVDGIDFSGGNNHTLSQYMSMNNNAALQLSFSNSNIISNMAADIGSVTGSLLNASSSSNNTFKHNFLLAPGASGCTISGGASVGFDTSCNMTGTSTATRKAAVGNFDTTFFSKVTANDTKNTSDTNGSSTLGSITDWAGFDNLFRGWGREHTDPFPSNTALNHRGVCYSAGNCRIWDWRISNSDVVLKNMSGDGNVNNQPFVQGSACPIAVDGNYTLTDQQVPAQTYLVNAMEILDDEIGDDDGLCESNEACTYSPHFGAYQGEGPLTPGTCNFNNGTVTGISMYAYTINGG
jgi:hypothetical protein